MRRITSHYLLTPEGLLRDRIVTVDADGVIADISETTMPDREPALEFYPGIIVPGFVNAHTHLELSHLRGAIAPGGGFTEFVRKMREVRGRFSEDERRAAAEYRDAKMWSEGVSAAGDICNGSETFGVKLCSRIRYHNFAELFGLGADPETARAMRREADAQGLPATVTPHSTYSLGRAAFAAAVGADANAPLSMHFMESEAEAGLFRRKGPLWDWYAAQGLEPDFLGFGGPAERLAAQVPADRAVMLVHNCCVTQRDIDIVMEHFTAPVTWVLCPGSNRYISGLEPPVGLLRKNRLRIAVGTDSDASNTEISMVRELGLLPGGAPLDEILGWATLGGAKALGMDGKLGSIEVGKSPGLILLTGVDMDAMSLTESATARRIV